MYEPKNAARLASSEDRRMWRRLLARLHPDAGGDHDLFTFACAVRDEMCRGERLVEGTGSNERARKMEGAAPFLLTWYEEMGRWSSSNRDALNNIRTR